MPQNIRNPSSRWPWTLLFSSLLVTGLASGCLDFGPANAAPEAVLDADKTKGEVGDAFRFDATKSNDPDGNLSLIRLDLGDGTVKEFYDPQEANVTHTYTDAGAFIVTLTVLDDGGEGEPQADSAETQVFVNDRVPVSAQVASVAPPGATFSTYANQTFNATSDAKSFDVNLTVQSLLLAGQTEITLRVVDANGTELANETVTVPASGNQTAGFARPIEGPGMHTLEIFAREGSARVTGEILVRYDEPAASP